MNSLNLHVYALNLRREIRQFARIQCFFSCKFFLDKKQYIISSNSNSHYWQLKLHHSWICSNWNTFSFKIDRLSGRIKPLHFTNESYSDSFNLLLSCFLAIPCDLVTVSLPACQQIFIVYLCFRQYRKLSIDELHTHFLKLFYNDYSSIILSSQVFLLWIA